MKMSLQYRALLEERGIALSEDFGIADIALERDAALIAADLLAKDEVPILGGDVYLRVGDRIELAYANWFTRQREGERLEAYIGRACSETKRYIKDFPMKADVTPLFVLVTAVES